MRKSNANQQSYLQTENLSVGYSGKALIDGIDIGVEKGRILTLIGPNGAGKSTILKSIAGQLELLGGTVYIDRKSLGAMPIKELAKKLAIVITERISPELMTCRDVVSTGRYPYTGRFGVLSASDESIVDTSLARVHAEELATQDFSKISDGQRQRVLLARALCQQPEVIVLDEPTSYLDIRHKLELLTLLKQLVREQNLAVVLSLHELDLASRISDMVVCVHEGRIARYGTPEQVFKRDYIEELYDVSTGSYNADYGTLELPRTEGAPRVFVIAGGGSGIAVYRRLQREGIPFAAGILWQNDADYPVAKALAVAVIEEAAFEPISDDTLRRALALMAECEKVLCCIDTFGTLNAANAQLKAAAEKAGKLIL